MSMVAPYTPGAGKIPNYLAGRSETLAEASRDISCLLCGKVNRSKIYYGLRGVGKTVLLNAVGDIAAENNVHYEHIEISERDNFKEVIALRVKKLILQLSTKETLKDYARKAAGVLSAFNIRWCPDTGSP
ncbi:MAG: hypothetical protein LBD23_12990, partial [Oscillospiraceae bacterium]|nr:hypothetical protein [Oscillospiraceae bacterium]